MFEIKIIGLDMMAKAIDNLADAIKAFAGKDGKKEEVNLTIDGSAINKPAKEVKNEAPAASKPVNEEPKELEETTEGAGTDGNEENPESNTGSEASQEQEESTVTLEEVRAKGTELARAGKRDLVKQVLEAAGASKLSDVPADKLGYVMQCFEKGKVM